jgi:mannose-6-phosphate isomerase-like protein (cupin superfamily)
MGTTRREGGVKRFDDVAWHVPVSDRADIDWDREPGDGEAGRKFLVDGEGGFYVQAVRVPPDFTAPLHHHSHPEVFMVVRGSCTFNGEAMGPLDSTVVEAGTDYTFTSGPEGVVFMVTRQAIASYAEASS